MAIDFNASAQCGLRVNRQLIGILKNNDFEHFLLRIIGGIGGRKRYGVILDIDSGKGFDFPSDELDTFFMRTIDIHDVEFHLFLVILIDFADELIDNSTFSCSRISMEEEMRDFTGLNEIR